jgi:2-polyprenyl-3-methyl-5-hydroxy-6-metoxy-1,4-benzoquinol methylase
LKTDSANNGLIGSTVAARIDDFATAIDFSNHKVKYFTERCRGKRVLDIGCVQHNPENYRSKFWLHRALKEVSAELVGLDLYEGGVNFLNARGFKILVEDAQNFTLNRKFDVIVAGDVIEHLEDLSGFLESCKRHLLADGFIAVSTPNPWYWKNFLKAALATEINVNPEHTCWLCIRTLRQLVRRHNMDLRNVSFGSAYLRDRLMPLPKGWKHSTFHAEIYTL